MSLSNDESSSKAPATGGFRVDLTQDEFDREFFGHVLEHGDSNPDVLRRQAELLARGGDHVGALRLDVILAERFPGEPVVFYNLACSHSLCGNARAAISALKRAIELGYNDFAHIESDPDLDSLRDLPSFQELLRRRMPDNNFPRLA